MCDDLAKGWVWDAVLVSMVTMYLSASEELAPVETIRETLRTVAKRAGRRYAQAKDGSGRVVATVEV